MRTVAPCRGGRPAHALLVLLIVIAASCGGGEKKEPGGAARGGETAREGERPIGGFADSTLVLEPLAGAPIRMSGLRGSIVVLNFWATWNKESVEMLGIMDALARRYRQYRFFAVAMDQGGAPVVRSFVATHSVSSEIIVNGAEVARSFGGVGKLPVSIVILRDGRVLKRFDGLYRSEKYEEVLHGIIRRRL